MLIAYIKLSKYYILIFKLLAFSESHINLRKTFSDTAVVKTE